MTRSYPGPRRMMTADEARDRGLGAVRGLVIGLFWSCLFWALMLGAYVIGQRR